MAKESEERQYVARRERCLAQRLTEDDIAADAELAKDENRRPTLAGAEPGDYYVTQVGHEPRLWSRAKFEEAFEPDPSEGIDAAE